MGKMYTLQPNESINDHVKDSMDIINHIVELSIGCMRDLANPHEGTFVDITFNKFMRSLEHIRESIQMLDELCDELEDDKDEIRHEYEEKVIQFFNRFMNADLNDEANYRLGECVRHIHEIENHYMSEIQQLEERLKVEHEKYMKLREAKEHSPAYWKDQFERMCKKSNQLEEQLTTLKCERDLAKKLAKNLINEKWTLKEELEEERKRSNQLERRCHDLTEDRDGAIEFWEGKFQEVKTKFELAKKFLHQRREEVSRLKEELRQTQLVNNPANFCGNCKYFSLRPNDVGFCNNKHADPFIVDPDDASCQAFESNKPNVVIDKPEFPCCEHCSHEDCDDCTLCPF